MRRFARSSPNQTFVLFPLVVLGVDVLRGRRPRTRIEGVVLMALGYSLYRYAGSYRAAQGGGERGFAAEPKRLVMDGPYALTRNPMYLGHLLFMSGLVLATRSPLAVALALRQLDRFTDRVQRDEERLGRLFGEEYVAYRERVPRWLPSLERTFVYQEATKDGDESNSVRLTSADREDG